MENFTANRMFLGNKKNVQHNNCQQYKQVKNSSLLKSENICIEIATKFKNIKQNSNLSATYLMTLNAGILWNKLQ